MADMYFDDFKPGQSFRTHGKTISEAEILQFAMVYDPQPLHMNAEFAKDGISYEGQPGPA